MGRSHPSRPPHVKLQARHHPDQQAVLLCFLQHPELQFSGSPWHTIRDPQATVQGPSVPCGRRQGAWYSYRSCHGFPQSPAPRSVSSFNGYGGPATRYEWRSMRDSSEDRSSLLVRAARHRAHLRHHTQRASRSLSEAQYELRREYTHSTTAFSKAFASSTATTKRVSDGSRKGQGCGPRRQAAAHAMGRRSRLSIKAIPRHSSLVAERRSSSTCKA